ncbi:MAG TPA: YlxR family protein [Candidatus Caccenecus avistercoris]|nr:YlxR family protein [Candidatus Caccenecus avistercoris]
MKAKKIPMRTCVITKEKCEKRDLLRIVRTPDGSVIIDPTGKANGRGAYLKKDIEVIKKAEKSKILERVLEVEVPISVYEEAINLCK